MVDRAVLAAGLDRGAAELAVQLADAVRASLLDYIELLVHWNQAYNLTAVRDPRAMVAYHLLDSLSLLPHLQDAERCLDMGSGAGLPGVVLALVEPERHWVLLDSNSKKTRFLQQVRMQLGLKNIEVVRRRITEYTPDGHFDVVTARALAGLDKLCHWAQPLLAPGGRLLAMKAAPDTEELDGIARLPVDYRSHPLTIPGIDGPRSLFELWFNT